jgi:hypothetical protein
VAICAKELQPAPEQRSTKYAVTPTVSVDAVQLNPTCVLETAVATRFAGAVGGVVSVPASVVAEALFEYPLRFPETSVARIW